MNRLALATLALLLTIACPGAEPRHATKTHDVRLNGHTFTLPDGFDIELVAGPPLVNRPIVADFDDDGRLYVADSSGSNDPVKVQLEKKPHRILRLEDTKGIGTFDKATVFADQMMFPEGVLWFEGSVYVGAPPSIWKLTDTKGTGTADQREEWYKGKTLGGCANDIHGPYAGPDGWIYWCKGGFEPQTIDLPGRKGFTSRAAHVMRCRPDGTGLEALMSGGMDNPVGLVWTPGGEMIFSSTFVQHPAGGRRDGLIHAVYGGVYGKDHGVLDGHPRTSPHLMPVMTHLGAAAPCGLVRYESAVFGKEYQDNLFACLFNMHKVTRHVLTPDGATFKTADSDFLAAADFDFHPTAVLEDADGSLLVIDTGGWYKLCCPTSQLYKPDVLGAIYRVRKTGAKKIEDPRGRKIEWKKTNPPTDLWDLLHDERPAVRRRAVAWSRANRDGVLYGLSGVALGRSSTQANLNAVKVAAGINDKHARSLIRTELLIDPDEAVRQAAISAIGLWRDKPALRYLLDVLEPSELAQNRRAAASTQNKRAAAEAIGRIGDKSAVQPLLTALARNNDQVLDHSLTFALIEIADPQGIATGLKHESPRVRRAALIALDQMADGKLTADQVAPELSSSDPALKETAVWIAGRHPEWGDALAGTFRKQLALDLPPKVREELATQLAGFARTPAIQQLLAEPLNEALVHPRKAILALHAIARSGLKELPEVWLNGLASLLTNGDEALIREDIAALRAVPPPKVHAARFSALLLKIAEDEKSPPALRLSALAAIPDGLTDMTQATFDFLTARLDRDQPVADRAPAADVLARARLGEDRLIALTAAFRKIAPTDINRLLDAFGQSTSDRVGLALLAALKTSSARGSLGVGTVKPRLVKFGPLVQKEAESLYALLNADAAKQKAHLEELLAGLKEGDIRRGQAVFNSTKVACSACHAIGYLGGTIGPDLTHIGKIREQRDLLESIVFPSSSFVRSYEPVQITTKKGKVYNGLVRRETADEVVLATGATEEVRIARQEIDEVEPGKVSIMPAGLEQQLTRQELADLVAFLKGCK